MAAQQNSRATFAQGRLIRANSPGYAASRRIPNTDVVKLYLVVFQLFGIFCLDLVEQTAVLTRAQDARFFQVIATVQRIVG